MKYTFDYKKEGVLGDFQKIVLFSKSPRRRELLSFLDPIISSAKIDERAIERKYMELYKNDDLLTRAGKTCCEISMAKSNQDLEENTLYISADTIVVFKDQIYNKPKDMKEAEKMFLSYFGNSHYVLTSVCLREKSYLEVFYCVARIDFVDFYDELKVPIKAYLSTKTSLDKAGAYGIQDLDPRFVKGISGDINTIVGMPVAETAYRIFGG